MSRLLRLASTVSLFAILALILLVSRNVQAKNNGGDPPPPCVPVCPNCGDPDDCLSISQSMSYSSVSLTEGNISEDFDVAKVKSAFGTVMDFRLIYNSYNADGTRMALDSMVGFGWTHTYNDFLFAQGSDMFRMRGNGRITRYRLGSGGTYKTSPGYFETLAKNPDGSFDVTTKHKTRYHYQSVPNTPFLVRGSVLRLITITDRNNNVITLTYSASGDLITVTDTYSRSFQMSYKANHHLVSIQDPSGQVTTITYNPSGCLITSITDATLHSRTYTYNALYQMTSMVDRDGRKFTIQYKNNLPFAELDANGGRVFSLTNTSNWATDPTQLALNYMRVYVASTTSKTDGRGNLWQYAYDGNGHPTTIVAPDGAATTYSYDPATLLVSSVTDADGHTTSYQYDGQGNVLQRKDANGNITQYSYEPVFNQVTSITDPNGRMTTYTYDGNGNRLSVIDPLGGIQSWTYDSHGNILTSTDKDNNTTSFTYDAVGNLLQTTDALSETTETTYDVMGDRTSLTDANSHLTQYQYDALHRLTTQIDALNDARRTFYDGEGNVVKLIDENGHTTRYAFDQRRRLIQETDALLKSTTNTYDANNNRTSMTDRNHHATSYIFDVQNRLVHTTDALGHTSSRTYDGVGNRLSETDANGHTTNYQYDALNRRVQSTDALGEVTQWGYDLTGLPQHPECTGPNLGSNKVTKHTDGNGKVIYYCYDGLDRQVIEIQKQGSTAYIITSNDAVTYTAYDANSNRLAMTEPDGNTTDYTYDALNRRIKMINAAGDTTLTVYDSVGNVHSTTMPNLNVSTNTYDALNRVIQQADSQGLVQMTSYDPVGNVTSQLDGNHNGRSYTHDADNRISAMTDALGKPITYTYDAVGNLLSVTDRNSNVTNYAYDAINRRTTITDAQPATTKYQYDNVGNLTKLTDANGHSTTYTYDKVNRRLTEKYPDLTHNTVTYTYDAVGNRITHTDQKGQIINYRYSDLYFLLQRTYPVSPADVFTYDLSGRMLTANRGSWAETYAYDGGDRVIQSVQNSRVVSYVYNVPGRMRTVTYPSGRAISEQMDYRSQLSTVNDGGMTAIAQYTYDAGERELTRTYRNGAVATHSYNANNWVTSLTHMMGLNLIVGFDYAFDNEGNKNYEQKLHELTNSEGYGYDNVYRLVNYQVGTLVGSTITMVITQTAYNLDPLGNWNSIVVTPGGTQTRTHSPSNEITQINSTLVLSDFNGNTNDDGTNLYAYDEENRLTKVTDKTTHAVLGQYQYDAIGRRVSKIDNFGVRTLFYYDDWRTVEEQNLIGVTQATYVFGNYLDEVLTMDRGGRPYYYHQNALWSVFALSDASGTGIEGYSYDTYGYQTLHLPGPDGILWTADDAILPGAKSTYGNPFFFTEQRYDPETGLMYYKNRYYDQGKGRFLQRDPEGYLYGTNLYEYVRSKPTKLTDSTGMGDGGSESGSGAGSGSSESGEGTSKCSKCGPDITLALIALQNEMKNHFKQKWNKRGRACDRSNWLDGWDIDQLHNSNQNPTNPGCPTPDCDGTVEMFGTCVHADEANYYEYGVMNALCYDESWGWDGDTFGLNAMVASIYEWKAFAASANTLYNVGTKDKLPPRHFLPTESTVWAAQLGWYQALGSSSGVNNLLSSLPSSACPTGCGKWNGTFTWHWSPIHNPRKRE